MKSDPKDTKAPLNASAPSVPTAPPSSRRNRIEDPVTDHDDALLDPRGDRGDEFRLQMIFEQGSRYKSG
jgi:hypothetical protein